MINLNNNFSNTIWQNIRLHILQITDAFYRVCVRLLYHSKVVGVLTLFWVIIFITSLGFYVSVLKDSNLVGSIQSESTQRDSKNQNNNSENNPQGFYTIDVGQGDSLLYITKKNQTFLIDTGKPGDGIVQKLEKILGKYRKKIDVVLLTHPDSDHVGEIDNILASFNVRLILYSPIYDARPISKKSIDEIRKKQKERNPNNLTLPIFAGANLSFSENEKAYFLSPSVSGMTTFISKKEIAEDNYFSVVSMIKNKDAVFTMADAPQKIEKVLSSNIGVFPQLPNLTGEHFNRNEFDKIILKVGHHGSKTSSAPDFIQGLSPTDAVLSYGFNNRYGHPNKEAVDALSTIPNIKIHRTISGTVYFSE